MGARGIRVRDPTRLGYHGATGRKKGRVSGTRPKVRRKVPRFARRGSVSLSRVDHLGQSLALVDQADDDQHFAGNAQPLRPRRRE